MVNPNEELRTNTGVIGRRLGVLLMVVGALVLGFVAYQLWGTAIEHASAQRRLRTEFEHALEQPAVQATVATAHAESVGPEWDLATSLPTATQSPQERRTVPKHGVDGSIREGLGADHERQHDDQQHVQVRDAVNQFPLTSTADDRPTVDGAAAARVRGR